MSRIKKNHCSVNVNVHCTTKSTRKKRKSNKKCKKKSNKKTLQISRCIPINKACDDIMPTPIFVGDKTSGISLPSGAITIVNTSETCTMQVAIEILYSMTPLVTEIEPRSSFTTTLADIIRVDIVCMGPEKDNCTGTVQLDFAFTVCTKLDRKKVKHHIRRHSFYDTEIRSINTKNRDHIEMLEPSTIENKQLERQRNIQVQNERFSKEMSKIVDKLDRQLKNLDNTINRRDELFLTALKEMNENQKKIGKITEEHPKKVEVKAIESIESKEKLKTEAFEETSMEKTPRNNKIKWWQKLFRISSIKKAN
ncbi:S-Ena type endospore appendage [Chengkuizengella sp. SCS-71B]|uniref:S-Ena type endospore appendage n=1 Tax=Chengkuizengella sp. SCS-71B TaxID=3115290 RepID=UPI0032C24833